MTYEPSGAKAAARSPQSGTSDSATIKGQRTSQAHLSFSVLRKRRVLCIGLSSNHRAWLGRTSDFWPYYWFIAQPERAMPTSQATHGGPPKCTPNPISNTPKELGWCLIRVIQHGNSSPDTPSKCLPAIKSGTGYL